MDWWFLRLDPSVQKLVIVCITVLVVAFFAAIVAESAVS